MATGMAYRDQRRPTQGRPSSANVRQQSFSRQTVPRRNGNTVNNYSNMSMENSQMSSDKVNQPNIYENEPMVSVMMSCLGGNAKVSLKNGKHMNGILSAVSPQNNIMLNIPKFTNDDRETIDVNASQNLAEQTSLLWTDIVDVSISMPYSDYQQLTTGFATDSSITRANGTITASERELEAWEDDTESEHLISLDDGADGWTAEEMIRTNERKFGVSSTYDSSLSQYTTAMPKFKTKEDQEQAERMAEKHAKEIEMAAGYRQREELENNVLIDEETKYSSVLREQEFSPASRPAEASARSKDGDGAAQKYVPPGLRNKDIPQQDSQTSRGPAGDLHGARQRETDRSSVINSLPTQLPQREPKERRGGFGARPQQPAVPVEQEGPRDRRWEKPATQVVQGQAHAPPTANQPPQQNLHNSAMDRLNGERRGEMPNRGFNQMRSPQTMQQAMPQHQAPRFGGQTPPQHPLHPSGPPSHAQLPPTQPPPAVRPAAPANLTATVVNGGVQPAASADPDLSAASKAPVVPAPGPVATSAGSMPAGGDRRTANRGASTVEKDRLQNLKHFHNNFRVELPDDETQEEKGPSVPDSVQSPEDSKSVHTAQNPASVQTAAMVAPPAATVEAIAPVLQPAPGYQQFPKDLPQQVAAATKSPQQGAVDNQDASSRSPQTARPKSPKQQQQHHQQQQQLQQQQQHQQHQQQQPQSPHPPGSDPGTGAQSPLPSQLNPLANDFVPGKLWANTTPGGSPSLQQMAHQPMQQVVQPLPNQRASPSLTLVTAASFLPAVMSQHPQHAQRQMQGVPQTPHSQTAARARKHAVVSVDNTAVQQMTGQPLQLAAQAATMQQPYVAYHQIPPALLQQGTQFQAMRVLQQGAGLEHAAAAAAAAASSHNHQLQASFLMAAQPPVPAHMNTPAMPQPTHTVHQPHHQHLPQHHGHPNMPPVSQTQVPNPAASPVPLGGPSSGGAGPGPQMNHTQGAPPQSGTPQPQMFGHPMQGLMPPGGGPHPMPAHGVGQGPSPALHFAMQHQIPGVAFSQAGGNSAGGPAPAHLQPSSLQNQQSQVVIMPQPPPHSINQPPHGHSHAGPHTHPQHAAAAAQFHQQLQQGAVNQMHSMGPNQHLLQGAMQGAAGAMNMQQLFMHHQQQNAMGGHHGHQHQLPHGMPHHAHHAHTHSLAHYQGQ